MKCRGRAQDLALVPVLVTRTPTCFRVEFLGFLQIPLRSSTLSLARAVSVIKEQQCWSCVELEKEEDVEHPLDSPIYRWRLLLQKLARQWVVVVLTVFAPTCSAETDSRRMPRLAIVVA